MPVIYPSKIYEYGDSLIFFNKATTQINHTGISIIVNDTIYRKLITDHTKELYPSNTYNMGAQVVEVFENNAYITNSSDYYNTPHRKSYKPGTHKICQFNLQKQLQLTTCAGTHAQRYIYYLDRNKGGACFYDYKNNTFKTIHLKGRNNKQEPPIHMYTSGNMLHIISPSTIHLLDSQLNISEQVHLDSFFGTNGYYDINNTYFSNNTFWGHMLSTVYDGLYISYLSNRNFMRSATDLDAYRYVGKADDSTGFWWQKSSHTLKRICNGKTYSTSVLMQIPDINKIIPFNDSTYMLLNNQNSSWLHKNGDITELVDGYEDMVFRHKNTKIFNGVTEIASGILNYLADCSTIDSNSIYAVGSSYNGINKVTFDKKKKKITIDSIYFDRYNNIVSNRHNNYVFVYTYDKILVIYNSTDNRVFISNEQLQTLGINGIEKIALDDFGNVFIKDYNKLIVANIFTMESRQLFSNYELEDALIDLDNNVLSIAGNFGVLRAKVKGPNIISDITTYPNTKQIFYNFVNSAQFSSGNVLLNTNKGTYLVNTDLRAGNTAKTTDYKITLSYDSTLCSISNNDTISVRQTVNNIVVDVIRPAGTGDLNIEYSINGSLPINSGYQVILPDLEPGSYNTILIVASDNSWKSKPVGFNIYIQPYWWQTDTSKKIIFAMFVIAAIGLIYIIIVITKRVVNQNNDRRNQRRELELKSIYSQINPHFIFNSLSTAQYFVKKNRNKEAYEHINQFSNLLRSYIKSSRNKYISITEEVQNLENYLQLQLTRFEEKFKYHISIDKAIDAAAIKIPSLLLQPIVENALNHGIFHSDKMGQLNIVFAIDPDNNNILTCVVEDNGIGRKRSKELKSELIQKATSYGTILIKELIDTFNKYEKIKIEIDYIDKVEPETGTIVIIKIENFTHV